MLEPDQLTGILIIGAVSVLLLISWLLRSTEKWLAPETAEDYDPDY